MPYEYSLNVSILPLCFGFLQPLVSHRCIVGFFWMILFLMQQRVHRLWCNCHHSLPFCYEVSLLDPFIIFFTIIVAVSLSKVPLLKSSEHSSAAPENHPLKPITLKSRAEHVVLINYSVSILRANFTLVTHQRPTPHPCRTANIPLLTS